MQECPLSHRDRPCTPSDHYGLFVVLSIDRTLAASQHARSAEIFASVQALAAVEEEQEAAAAAVMAVAAASRPPHNPKYVGFQGGTRKQSCVLL
jgi:hypothetical protein